MNRPKNDKKLLPCFCCGQWTIEEYGNFEICVVCGWEDDSIQSSDPDYMGGANKSSLNEYRKQFLAGQENEKGCDRPAREVRQENRSEAWQEPKGAEKEGKKDGGK